MDAEVEETHFVTKLEAHHLLVLAPVSQLQRNLASEVRGDKTSPDYGRPNYVEKYGCIGCLLQKNIADQDQGNIAMNDIILLLIELNETML